jgi:hypothetical protein
MADEVDRANEHVEREEAMRIDAARRAAALIPAGAPGDCDLCGEWSGRLVGGACALCRDRKRLP